MLSRLHKLLLSVFLSSEKKLKRKVDKATRILDELKVLNLPAQPVLTNLGDFILLESENLVPVMAFRMDEVGHDVSVMVNRLSDLSLVEEPVMGLLRKHFDRTETTMIDLAFDKDNMIILMGETAVRYHDKHIKTDNSTDSDMLLN